MEFDGIVLEAWSLWRSYRILEDTKLRKKVYAHSSLQGPNTAKAFWLKSWSGLALKLFKSLLEFTCLDSAP
jgi:hypothetical protein